MKRLKNKEEQKKVIENLGKKTTKTTTTITTTDSMKHEHVTQQNSNETSQKRYLNKVAGSLTIYVCSITIEQTYRIIQIYFF